jgi:hypothetical protein
MLKTTWVGTEQESEVPNLSNVYFSSSLNLLSKYREHQGKNESIASFFYYEFFFFGGTGV